MTIYIYVDYFYRSKFHNVIYIRNLQYLNLVIKFTENQSMSCCVHKYM